MKNPLAHLPLLARLAAVVATFWIPAQLQATIIGGGVTLGSGSFVILTPPFSESNPDNSVGNDTFQNANLYAFNEDQNVLVGPGALTVNVIASGHPNPIPAGTEVASHYVFFDPLNGTHQKGFVDFDADVLAIISSTANLASSDYLANTSVTYLNPSLRGLETGDSAIIDPGNPKRILVDWTASTPGDYVRVLTKHSPGAVPDHGSSFLLLCVSAGLLGLSRRLDDIRLQIVKQHGCPRYPRS